MACGAVAPVDLDQPVGDVVQGFVPGDLAPLRPVEGLGALPGLLRCLADQRRGDPLRAVDEVVAEAALDAQVAVVDHRIERAR